MTWVGVKAPSTGVATGYNTAKRQEAMTMPHLSQKKRGASDAVDALPPSGCHPLLA